MDTLEQLREARESALLKLEVKQLQAAASMPILEEWGDVVNTREYLTDDPSFGMQSLGYIYATNIDDRKDGAFRPVYETEADLARIRGQVRNLYAITAIPDGAKESLANYVLGTGFEFTADAINDTDSLALQLAAHCRGIIDRFCEESDFHGVIDREMHWRSREDGECFAQLVVTDGKVQVELLEADQIVEPHAARPLEDWLGVGASCWKFGVHTPLGRTWLPLGYHVVRDGVGNDWEYVKADRMEHIKRNVTRNAKRGYSDFYGVIADLMHEAKLRRNMVQGAALQAAIAFIMQGAAGQTQAQLQATASADRVASYTRPAGSGGVSKVQNANHIPVGTILRAGYGQEYKAGPMGAERNAGFELVGQYVLRSIGVRWNMPEYLISGDASNANYSSTLVAQSPFVKARVADQQFYKRHFLSMLWKVLRIHFDSGRFSRFPGIDFDQLRLMVKLEATPPTVESRDPAQMATVHAAYLDKGLISKQTAREQAGLDHEQEEKRGAIEKPPEPKFMPPGFGGVQEAFDPSQPRDADGKWTDAGSNLGEINIYRAADDDDIRIGHSFSEDAETAKAYLNNPGFGGENLYRKKIEVKNVLDLTSVDNEWKALADASGVDIKPSRFQHHFGRVLPTDETVASGLAANGYHWVRFNDDFPEGAKTLIPVSNEAVDMLDGSMKRQRTTVDESYDPAKHPRDSKGRFASTGSTGGDYGSAENSAVPHLTRMRRLRNAVGSVLEFMRKIPKFAAGGLERHEQVFADIDRWIGTAQRHLTTVHDVGGKALDRAETIKAEADKVRELVKRAKSVFESAGLPMVGKRLMEDGRADPTTDAAVEAAMESVDTEQEAAALLREAYP